MTTAIMAILKKLIVSMLGKAFLEWLLFWVAELIVESTKTEHDDKFFWKVKEAYYDKSNRG